MTYVLVVWFIVGLSDGIHTQQIKAFTSAETCNEAGLAVIAGEQARYKREGRGRVSIGYACVQFK